MSEPNLIQQLVKDLKPVKTLAPLWQRIAIYLAATVGIALLELFVIAKIQPAVFLAFKNSPTYLFETVLIFFTPVIAAIGALILSVPGNENKQWVQYVAAGSFAAFILFNFYNIWFPVFPNATRDHYNEFCVYDIVSLGTIPALLLFFIIRMAAPLNWKWLSGLITLGSFGPLVAVQQLTCMGTAPHVLAAHVLPVLLISIAIYYIGRKFI